MAVMRRKHLALYGNVGMVRAKCPSCKYMALVVRGEFQCCGKPFTEEVSYLHRVCEPVDVKHGPSSAARKEILAEQGGRCAWCDRTFGGSFWVGGRLRTLVVRWDHVLPHAFSQNNHDSNFVAACQMCNSWKSDKVFQYDDEVRAYVAKRWERETARPVLGVREVVRGDAEEPAVLLPGVQEQGLDAPSPTHEGGGRP